MEVDPKRQCCEHDGCACSVVCACVRECVYVFACVCGCVHACAGLLARCTVVCEESSLLFGARARAKTRPFGACTKPHIFAERRGAAAKLSAAAVRFGAYGRDATTVQPTTVLTSL